MVCTALLVGATKLILIVDIGTFLQELHVQVYSNITSCTLLTDYCSVNFLALGESQSIISTPHRVPHIRTVSRILFTSSQLWPSSTDHMTKYSELPTLITASVPQDIDDSGKGDSDGFVCVCVCVCVSRFHC